MTKRKPTRKKKTRRKSRKRKLFQSSIVNAIAGIALLAVLVALAGVAAHFLITPQKPSPPKSIPSVKQPIAKIPTFEIYPKKELPPLKKSSKPPISKPGQLPKVAIIIDDLGYDRKIAEKFSQLDIVITFSILPHSPHQSKIARLAQSKGIDTMLHLPMEPIEWPNVNPGPGTLLTSMTADELIDQLEKNLDAVPNIKGVNNHMGSRMTAESSQMYQIFTILKKKELFFIDSRTTNASLCKPSARLFQIPFAQRDVFLDHLQEPDFIRKQIKELIKIARLHGHAVGIGHAHAVTYKILRDMLPDLKNEVQLVPASEIVSPVG
ncbi:MAG: divergent polysaccharide deacetylase family protein [Desulfobacterales bacterium]|jgi:hypothetical protein